VALLALPSVACAQFAQLSPFTGTFNCPGPIAYGSGGVYFGDACEQSSQGQSSTLWAYLPDGSGVDTTFAGGSVADFTGLDGQECFYWIGGVAVDPATGDVYVSDENSGTNALFDFSDTGTDKAQIGTPCNVGGTRLLYSLRLGAAILNGPASIYEPQGLAVYGGNLYVAGGGHLLYTPLGLGGSISSFPVQDANPIALAIDPSTGAMFVIDASGTIYEYDASGAYVGTFASGLHDPTAIAVDPVAHVVYVADAGTGTIDTFNEATGAALLETPTVSGQDPYGVALDTTNHVLYATYAPNPLPSPADSGAGSVQRFSYTPPPACNAGSASTKGGVAATLALSCTDAAGAPVSYAIATQPAHGTLSALNTATGAVTYTPNGGFDGTDSFTYTGSSVDGSTTQTVTVTVSGPTCAPETLSTAYQAALSLTLACSDSASPVTTYEILTPPSHGVLTAPSASGHATYTPQSITVGSDSFTYEGVNANGQASAPQTVTIYLGAQLPPPVQDQSANLYFAYGNVTVLLPGQTTPIPLTGGLQAPLGSIVNATGGGAGVFVEDNGQLQGANFWNGAYKLTQQGDPQTILHLLGKKIPKVRCALHPHSFSGPFTLGQAEQLGGLRKGLRERAKKKFHEKGKPTRQLWGNGHGNFTTVGNGSSASVRGTEWAVFDYPDGTLTFDYTDSVSVYDFHRHKHVTITAGHYYFAALGNLPPCPGVPR
jgi:DNA-binding beta-propeller fold protein YncE